MYTFSKKLKIFAFILIGLGLVGVISGFMSSHKSFDEVETLLANESAHHGGGHASEGHHDDTHVVESDHGSEANHHAETSHDSHDAHAQMQHTMKMHTLNTLNTFNTK